MKPDEILISAADSPSDFQMEGNLFELSRSGVTYSGELIERRGVGTLVKETDGTVSELTIYVQKRLFRLDYLANQILKKLEEVRKKREVDFIDSPAQITSPGGQLREVDAVFEAVKSELLTSDFGSTKLVTLMAPAGQGKTVLIEHIAIDSVLAYQPSTQPLPIILPVDLLGRNVGNIDDAIAGSLNNTYGGPQLRQRDVLFCLRNNWLSLALDGFDELVARVGVADAFTHVATLIDDLDRSGTILLSGRKSFFETFEIRQAIGRFLRPRTGAYSTVSVELMPWREEQAVKVFENLNFMHARQTLHDLAQQFHQDKAIIYHPFFLTRIAMIMRSGHAIVELGNVDSLGRAKWVIETFLRRELGKWTNKAGLPLLSMDQHTTMLGGVAEEMWISGAFILRLEELRLAALIGLNHLRLSTAITEEVTSRISTHAAFMAANGSFSFFHEQLSHFALGERIAYYLSVRSSSDIARLFIHRTLPPDTINWSNWFFRQNGDPIEQSIQDLNMSVAAVAGATILNENLALIAAALADGRTISIKLINHRFYGDALFGRKYKNVTFENCTFWQVNLDTSYFESCSFLACEFGLLQCSNTTNMINSRFDEDCTFEGIQSNSGSAYSEAEIVLKLVELGAKVERKALPIAEPKPPTYELGLIRAVERLVRSSLKTCDIAAEDFDQWHPEYAKEIIRNGLSVGILKPVQKQTGGPNKTFYRIQVDKQNLLSARTNPDADTPEGKFWKFFQQT